MAARTGQFRRSMTKRFGAARADKAERCVTDLKAKYGTDSGKPFAICTASMAKAARKMKGR